ncbi:MAG: hypothetical protein ACYC2T_09000 [Bacillota bacterium]
MKNNLCLALCLLIIAIFIGSSSNAHPDMTLDRVRDLTLKLNLNDGLVFETSTEFNVKSNTGKLIVDKETGAFIFTTKEYDTQSEPLKVVLSDELYKKKATEFLIGTDLMKNNAIYKGIAKDTVTRLENGIKTYPYMIDVRFEVISNIPWVSRRSKLAVFFGENGRITGAYLQKLDLSAKYN